MQLEYNHLVNGDFNVHRISSKIEYQNDIEKTNFSFEVETYEDGTIKDHTTKFLQGLIIKLHECIDEIEKVKL